MSSLILKNQRVYDFYNNHKHFDFEKMNILLVDLLENFQESALPSFNANVATKLCQQLEKIQTQINEKDELYQLSLFKQMTEWKTGYIEELKTTIQQHHQEQIMPTLREQMERVQEKIGQWQQQSQDGALQSQGEMLKKAIIQDIESLSQKTLQKDHLQDFVRTIEDRLSMLTNASESRLQERFRDHTRQLEDLKKLGYGQESMQQQVGDLLRKLDNSSSKGKVSENMLGHVIHSLYPSGEIKAVGTTKETGDILMLRDGMPTILFENKNYDRNVGQEEVQKFLRDVETQKCCGILLAQNYGIANRQNYEIHIYQGQVCVYLHSVQYDPDKIKVAVDIIDHLMQYIESGTIQGEDIHIDYDFLHGLNKEYQGFVQQKLTQIKIIKDYSQKMLAQVDEMKLPQYEQWLGKYFSQSLSAKDNQCKYCGFEAKTSNGLVSHLRACKKKLERNIGEINADSCIVAPEKPVKPANISVQIPSTSSV